MFKKLIFILLEIFFIINSILIFPIQAYQLKEEGKSEENSSFIICIDPGHQGKGDSRGEPIAPGSSAKKPRVSSGTAGIATKKSEHAINLEASLILKELLLEKGYTVIMTREEADVNISNAERAQIANNAKANMTIRIHCDSLNDTSKSGASILVPDKNGVYTKKIYDDSYKFSEILKSKLECENIKVNGIFERKDITGFNWSTVPVVILEMGFMSNYNEDKMLSDKSYQMKLMECVSKSIDEYKDIKN